MPRYIDVDKAIPAINDEMFANESTKSLFRRILRAIPTADVVPRAEIERIFDDVIEILNNEFRKCEKNEVQIVLKISRTIFELKKKYTEEQK